MDGLEAWHIISANLMELYKHRRATYGGKGYTEADTTAAVICFKALQEMEKRGADK